MTGTFLPGAGIRQRPQYGPKMGEMYQFTDDWLSFVNTVEEAAATEFIGNVVVEDCSGMFGLDCDDDSDFRSWTRRPVAAYGTSGPDPLPIEVVIAALGLPVEEEPEPPKAAPRNPPKSEDSVFCPGSGAPPIERRADSPVGKRRGECPACGQQYAIPSSGRMRKHRKPA